MDYKRRKKLVKYVCSLVYYYNNDQAVFKNGVNPLKNGIMHPYDAFLGAH